ncbi:uncharacterized protein LOC132738406 [Ruditapes philippinarum]|uniref:uncharacterized protein LOC132738406 n=1 Tax=Ruditapes philippinarum TaxID=129788 RepID=UPI00295B9E46|nr:uncharacterized protein LOC132738406 [Ruditapes philippinarum]
MARVNTKSQRELYEFGHRCHSCINRYCLKCFRFECTLCRKDCKCKTTDCECERFPKLINKKLIDAKYWLISQRTPPSSIDISLKYNFFLHNGEVCLSLMIVQHKDFDKKAVDNTTGNSNVPENYMELKVDIKEGTHLRKKYASKQTVTINIPTTKCQKISVYCGETSDRHKQCLYDLNRLLEKKNIFLEFTYNPDETLAENENPLLVISLIHSRAVSDVMGTLSRIGNQYYKRVIVVLLHFKDSDERRSALTVIDELKVFQAVDYFLNQKESLCEVADSLTSAIEKFDMQRD